MNFTGFPSRGIVALLALGLGLSLPTLASSQKKIEALSGTETVVATYRVKEGKEAEFSRLIAKAWPTYHRLGMVLDRPHIVLRGADESGKMYFIEILTWKSRGVLDNAPAEVTAIWDQMQPLCEERLGHRGIEISEVQIVISEKQ